MENKYNVYDPKEVKNWSLHPLIRAASLCKLKSFQCENQSAVLVAETAMSD